MSNDTALRKFASRISADYPIPMTAKGHQVTHDTSSVLRTSGHLGETCGSFRYALLPYIPTSLLLLQMHTPHKLHRICLDHNTRARRHVSGHAYLEFPWAQLECALVLLNSTRNSCQP